MTVKANDHQIDPKDNVFPDSIPITEGTIAPFSGVLLNEKKSNSIKNELIDKDACFKEIDLYKSNQSLISQQVTILLNQNKLLIEQKQQEVKRDEFNKYVLFGSGILVTALSVYLANKLTK